VIIRSRTAKHAKRLSLAGMLAIGVERRDDVLWDPTATQKPWGLKARQVTWAFCPLVSMDNDSGKVSTKRGLSLAPRGGWAKIASPLLPSAGDLSKADNRARQIGSGIPCSALLLGSAKAACAGVRSVLI
jgi:hypothetical protein